MDRNLLLAVVLSMGVYLAWFAFVEKRLAPPAPPAAAVRQLARSAAQGASVPGSPQSMEPRAASIAGEQGRENLPASTRGEISDTFIQIRQADLTIRNFGASLSSYRFHGPLGLVELVQDSSIGMLATWPDIAFTPVARAPIPGGSATPGSPPIPIWESRHPAGFVIRKEIRFGGPGELHHIRITFSNPSGKSIRVPAWEMTIGPGLGTVESEKKDNSKMLRAVGLFPPSEGRAKDEVRDFKPGDHEGASRWLAIDNRYFLAAVVTPLGLFEHFRTQNVTVDGSSLPQMLLMAKAQALAPGARADYDIPFYLGPKAYPQLQALGLGLERSVNFGWFDTLGRYILKILQYLYRVTGNYGWSIILLTLLIQGLLFPLTYKSLKATFGMKKIQPEIAKLQQKFKDDPKRLNVEMMELYKAKGVNPMGGCLPMLIQMPVFVALYNALRSAWELHGAPWVFWVHDLSAHDPFYILPLIMGGVMFFQNRINPAVVSDPTQAQMMMWMPVIFTFMFLKFPAGLVLYWLTNSLMGVVQQLVLRKRLSED